MILIGMHLPIPYNSCRMEGERSLLGLINMLRQIDWSSKASLLTASAINFLVVVAIAIGLGEMNIEPESRWYAITILVLEILIIARWVYSRYIHPFDPKALAIGFAIDAPGESQKLYDEIFASFNRHIQQNRLEELVHIKLLPADIKFRGESDAQKYLDRKGLRLIIWGDTSRATLAGTGVTIFNINVTYNFDAKSMDDANQTKQIVDSSIKRKAWSIFDDNSLPGQLVVAENVIEIALFTLSVCLTSLYISTRDIRMLSNSTRLLEQLRTQLIPRIPNDNFPNLIEVRNHISESLFIQYSEAAVYFTREKRDPKESYEWAFKAVSLQPHHFEANIQMALSSWLVGDASGARKYSKIAQKIDPKNTLPYLNFAFFHFYNDKHAKALSYYKRLNNKIVNQTHILDVISFLEAEYDKTDKPALLFAAAWLSNKYADSKRAALMMRTFMDLADGDDSYTKLLDESKAILRQAVE